LHDRKDAMIKIVAEKIIVLANSADSKIHWTIRAILIYSPRAKSFFVPIRDQFPIVVVPDPMFIYIAVIGRDSK
jgi:hypothetical protein